MAASVPLIWDLIARDNASRTFTRVGDSASGAAKKTSSAAKTIGLFGVAVAATAAAVTVHAVKMAGDFQYQMNRMTVAAGESQKNLKSVSDGVLKLMGATGTSAKDLLAGLYLIESAGYHGAAGLQVLGVAAKGAKIENADLATVANAVTSAMVDYHVSAGNAAQVMNTLIAAVAHGKTTLADLSMAFSNVGAAGASANVPMADLAAAIATMTMHGTDAAKAGTYLRQVIGQLEAPSAKARKVMEALGLDANKVGHALSSGPGGLANAIQMLEDAITKHLTPAGLVALNVFTKSKDPVTAYQKVLANLPPTLVTTFGALAEMTGGVRSLQGFLQLGGQNLATFRTNTLAVNEAVKAGGKNIEGWSATQQTLNVQLDKMKQGVNALWIRLGTALLPVLTKAADAMSAFISAAANSKVVHEALSGAVVVLKVVAADIVTVWHGLVTFFNDNKTLIIGVLKGLAGGLLLVQKAFEAIAPFVAHHKVLFETLAVAVLGAATAFVTLKTALEVAGVLKGLFLFLTANPILDVILAVAALAAGLVYLYFHSKRFRTIVDEVWHHMQILRDVFKDVWTVIKVNSKIAWDILKAIFDALKLTVTGTITGVKDTVNGLKIAWRDTWGAMKAVWDAVSPTILTIGKILYAVLGGPVLLTINTLKAAWKVLWGFLKAQWDVIGKPMLDFIMASIKLMWNNVAKPIFQLLAAGWKLMWAGAKVIWDTVGKPIFDTIKTIFDGLWNDVLKPVFSWISKGWDDLWSAFPKAVSGVWDVIKSLAVSGINDIIDVLNGFISAIDWILDKLPGNLHINPIGKISVGSSGTGATGGSGSPGALASFANGGVLPGYAPGKDSILAMLSPGEGVLVPDAVRALGGAKGVGVLNTAFGGKFGIGGLIGGAIGAIGSAVGAIGGAIKKTLFTPLRVALDIAEMPVKAAFGLLPAGIMRSLGQGLFGRMDHSIRSLLFDQGGMLPPGLTLAVNNTGKPEPVGMNNGYKNYIAHQELHVHYPLTDDMGQHAFPALARMMRNELDAV